jgi:hypothetical protein
MPKKGIVRISRALSLSRHRQMFHCISHSLGSLSLSLRLGLVMEKVVLGVVTGWRDEEVSMCFHIEFMSSVLGIGR